MAKHDHLLAASIKLSPSGEWISERLPRACDVRGLLIVACAAGLLSCLPFTGAWGQPSGQASPTQIAAWIDELSHDSFAVRESAAEKLLAAGPAARGALAAVADAPDPEVRAAARRILSQIDTTDLQRRLNAFAADVDGRAGVSLPGWEEFQKLVGGGPAERALFVEMQRDDSDWIQTALGNRGTSFTALWVRRLQQLLSTNLNGRSVPPPVGSSAAMIFLSTLPELEPSNEILELVAQVMYRFPQQGSSRVGAHRDSLRRVMVAWILHCPSANENTLQHRLALAEVNEFREAVPLAVAVATQQQKFAQAELSNRLRALFFVGKIGGEEYVDEVEPLLGDKTVCFPRAEVARRVPGAGNVDVEVRDVALNVLLRMTGQSPADYGYRLASDASVLNSGNVVMMMPRSAEERESAIAKWRQWKHDNRPPRQQNDASQTGDAAKES